MQSSHLKMNCTLNLEDMMLTKKPLRFAFVYALVVVIYYVFDYLYMPWLAYWFGYWLFFPLYLSIVVANFLGVFLYDYFGEDIFFIELGKNWLKEDGRRFRTVKSVIRNSGRLTFVILSIYPSPIDGYLFIRKDAKDRGWRAFRVIAVGSIFCTAVFGGVLSLAVLLIRQVISLYTTA